MPLRNDIQRGLAVAWYLDQGDFDWAKPGARKLAATCLQQAMQVSRATGFRLAAIYAHFHGHDNKPAKAPRTRQERRAGFPPHGPVV